TVRERASTLPKCKIVLTRILADQPSFCARPGSFGARFLTVAFLPVWLNILELPFPQISQPISNLCGLFEFHLLGRMTHVGLELLDRFFKLFRRILLEF